LRGNIGVGDLSERMDAGVGAPGTMQPDPYSADNLESAFDVILHRVAARLALPAFEWRAIIGDEQFQAFRGNRIRGSTRRR
jgi:hypothetical protein